MTILHSFDARFVVLSVVVATLASFVALDLAGRTQAASGRARALWLSGGSIVMGVGIWSMHFLGMLAFELRTADGMVTIAYDRLLLLASVLVAIAASALALGVAARVRVSILGLACAGFPMGGAIAGMHYLGMASMRMSADIHYDPLLVTASVAIAVAAAIVALFLARRLGETRSASELWAKAVAASVMGFAITGMHYTAMAAARFTPAMHPMALAPGSVVATSGLAVAVAAGAVLVLAMAAIGTAIDRRHGQLGRTVRSTQARYLSLSQSLSDAVLCTDESGRIVFWNGAAERIFGYPVASIVGQPLSMLLADGTAGADGSDARLPGLGRTTLAGTAGAMPRSAELEGRRQDGSTFPVELTLTEWPDDGQRFFTGIIRDITERKRAEASLRESEARYRHLVEQSPEAIVLHAGGVTLYANPAAAALVGVTSTAALRHAPLSTFVDTESAALIETEMRPGTGRTDRQTLEYKLAHANGRELYVEATSVSAEFEGRPAVQTHLRDVTNQKALEAELAHQAFHDALTGIANRALFRDRVKQAVARAKRGGSEPAVLFVDIDNFKAVNDGLGHTAGDELLTLVARRLTGVVRPSDTCARLGGDEFGILIDESDETTDAADGVAARAAHVAERIIAALDAPCRVADADITVSASIGIALFEAAGDETDILRNADVAMYRAKAEGKGRYQVYEPLMHQAVRARLEMETELRRAVEQLEPGEGRERASAPAPFVLHYQPIASLASSAVGAVEALVRWNHPRRGSVPPLDFIPLAEETGLIVPLGRWILREACRQARAWQLDAAANGLSNALGVTVNISARQLVQPELLHDVARALEASGLAPECLTLEMTESMLVDDTEAMLARLAALKAIGIRLAIDDFGTGYSSLGYLERFPVDLLKIDKSFIDKLGGTSRESSLARAIVGLGRELGMHVVAEGIETASQWSRLRALGCDLGQGYFLSRPVPAGEVPEAVRRQRYATA